MHAVLNKKFVYKVETLHWTATYDVTMLGTHTYTTHEKFAIHLPVHGYLGLARLVQQWKVANHYIQGRVQFTLTFVVYYSRNQLVVFT